MKPTVARVAPPSARTRVRTSVAAIASASSTRRSSGTGSVRARRHEGGRGRDEEVDGERDAVVHSPDCASRRHARER